MPSRQPVVGGSPLGPAVVRQVWGDTLEAEFALLRRALATHAVVALDVEFPGVVARSVVGAKDAISNEAYEMVRVNVDLLNPVQVALVLTDAEGNFPTVPSDAAAAAASASSSNSNTQLVPVAAWNFNFRFSLRESMYSLESVEMLQAAGVDFAMAEQRGIDAAHFGELLTSSGVILDDDVTLVAFHSAYAVAYLLKLATCKPTPPNVDAFHEAVTTYLPRLWDVRQLVTKLSGLKFHAGGLDALAKELGVERDAAAAVGKPHLAASDALLASAVYFELLTRFFPKGDAASVAPGTKGVVFGLKQQQHHHHHGSANKQHAPPSASTASAPAPSPVPAPSPTPPSNVPDTSSASTTGTASSTAKKGGGGMLSSLVNAAYRR